MKHIADFLMMVTLFIITGSSVSQTTQKPKPSFYQAADSLRQSIDKAAQLNHVISSKVDSIAEINNYLQSILKSHDYRVYKYTNPRIKLIYKWQNHQWELVRKIYY